MNSLTTKQIICLSVLSAANIQMVNKWKMS